MATKDTDLRTWTVAELIGCARGFDNSCERANITGDRSRYSFNRRVAFTARRYARTKLELRSE